MTIVPDRVGFQAVNRTLNHLAPHSKWPQRFDTRQTLRPKSPLDGDHGDETVIGASSSNRSRKLHNWFPAADRRGWNAEKRIPESNQWDKLCWEDSGISIFSNFTASLVTSTTLRPT